jgi:secondary thiamine-phosphate synthase enzyme
MPSTWAASVDGSLRWSGLKVHQEDIEVRTPGRGFVDLTARVKDVVRRSDIQTGLCVVFCGHTSASLLIQENYDPQVRHDLLGWLERAAPDGDRRFRHTAEGPDDMPAHVRSAITKTSESIPVRNGDLALGTWQAVYLVEHRLAGHARSLVVHVTGI